MKCPQIRLLACAVFYTTLFFNEQHTFQSIFTQTYMHQHLSFESCVLLMDTQTTTAIGEHTGWFYLMIQLIAFYSKHSELHVCCHMHREGSNRQGGLVTAAFSFHRYNLLSFPWCFANNLPHAARKKVLSPKAQLALNYIEMSNFYQINWEKMVCHLCLVTNKDIINILCETSVFF